MDEKLAANNVVGNAVSYEDMAYTFADNASEKKLKKLGLKNTIRSWENTC